MNFDVPDFESLWPKAFDFVAADIQMPSETAMEKFRYAFSRVKYSGFYDVQKALAAVWPADARWPRGEAYLRSMGWLPDSEVEDFDSYEYDGDGLLILLFGRVMHAHNRMYRDAQVKSLIHPDSPMRNARYTHVIVNRHRDCEHDPCGFGPDKVLSIEEGLALMRSPCHDHLECRCSIDPYVLGKQI